MTSAAVAPGTLQKNPDYSARAGLSLRSGLDTLFFWIVLGAAVVVLGSRYAPARPLHTPDEDIGLRLRIPVIFNRGPCGRPTSTAATGKSGRSKISRPRRRTGRFVVELFDARGPPRNAGFRGVTLAQLFVERQGHQRLQKCVEAGEGERGDNQHDQDTARVCVEGQPGRR